MTKFQVFKCVLRIDNNRNTNISREPGCAQWQCGQFWRSENLSIFCVITNCKCRNIVMATGGGDLDTSEQMLRDIEMTNDDAFRYNVSVSNRFDIADGWGNDGYQVVDRSYKRKRISTGSAGAGRPNVTLEGFESMTTDGKLSVLFDIMTNVQTNQDRTSVDIQNINSCIMNTCQQTDRVERCVNEHSKQLKLLSYHSLDIEARSRRNNIIFWGLTENTSRNCEDLILNFMARDMGIDTGGMVIDRAHRVGAITQIHKLNRTDPKRPVIARFRDYRDTEHILERSHKLKGTKFRIDRDYPKEIVEARKRLQYCEEAVNARKRGVKVQIKYPARLFINGQFVRDEFPDWYDCMKINRIDGTSVTKNQHDIVNPRSVENRNLPLSSINSNPVQSDNQFLNRSECILVRPGPSNINTMSRDDNVAAIDKAGDYRREENTDVSFPVESILRNTLNIEPQGGISDNNKQNEQTQMNIQNKQVHLLRFGSKYLK